MGEEHEWKEWKDTEEELELPEHYWGHNFIILTKEDIRKLGMGKVLCWTDGEYTTSISIEKEEKQ